MINVATVSVTVYVRILSLFCRSNKKRHKLAPEVNIISVTLTVFSLRGNIIVRDPFVGRASAFVTA